MTLTRFVRLLAVVLAVSLAATGCVRTKTLVRVKDVTLHAQAFPASPKIEAASQNTVADIEATATPDEPLGAPHVASVTTVITLKRPLSDSERAFLKDLPETSVLFDEAGQTVRLFYREKVDATGEPDTYKYTLRSPLPFLTIPHGSEKSGVVVLPAPTVKNKDATFEVRVVHVGDESHSKVAEGINGQRTTVTWYARDTDPWQIVYNVLH